MIIHTISKNKAKHVSTLLFMIIFMVCIPKNIICQNNNEWIPPPIQLINEETDYSFTLLKDQVIYFKYEIDLIQPDYDISISATPLHNGDDPDIYVSIKNKYPNSTSNAEYYAISWGYDLLAIPTTNFTQDQILYIGFVCASPKCDFVARLQYSYEFTFEANREVKMTWLEKASEVLKIYVPPADPQKTIEHMIIYAKLTNALVLESPFHMYINKGNEIPSSIKHNIMAEDSWFDGKAAIIYANDSNFCTNCNYTVIIEAQNKSVIIAGLKTYGHLLEIELDNVAYDAVNFRKNVTYELDISSILDNEQSLLSLEFIPYYGQGLLYVNPNDIPLVLSDYKWNLTEYGRERLIISHKDLIKANIDKYIYITIYGKTTCTYSIKATNVNSSLNILEFGTPHQGFIQKNEVQNFVLFAWGETAYNITLNLFPELGNPDLYLKSCQAKTKCYFTLEEIEDLDNGNTFPTDEYPLLLVSNNTRSAERIRFLHNSSLCSSSLNNTTEKKSFFDSVCLYAVGVISRSIGESHYNLIAELDKIHKKLREGRSYKSHLGQGQKEYFSFNVLNDTQIEKVKFQITPISGELDTFISKIVFYPNITNNDKGSFYSDLIIFTNNDFKYKNQTLYGIYYITISGFTDTTYSITAYLEYVEGGNQSSLIKLWEGIPQKYVMNYSEIAYFSLNLNDDNADDQNSGIEIIVKPITGSYILYVSNNGSIPTNESHMWYSYGNSLIIQGTDEKYKPNGTYYISIYPDQPYDMIPPFYDYENDDSEEVKYANNSSINAQNGLNYAFIIGYVSKSRIYTLQSGIPYTNTININRTIYYNFGVLADDKDIIITKLSNSGSFDIYLSVDELNPFPSKENYNYTTADEYSNIIKLNQQDIQKACPPSRYYCSFYLSIITDSIYDVEATIVFNEKKSFILLDEGRLLIIPNPEKNNATIGSNDDNEDDYIKFYHYPQLRTKNVNIIVTPYHKDLMIYANIIDINYYPTRTSWLYPTSTNYTYSIKALRFHTNEMNINGNDFDFCTDLYYSSCVLVISVKNYDNDVLNQNQRLLNTLISGFSMWDSAFIIMATSEIQQIFTGKPIYSIANANSYKYFRLKVNQATCNMLVSLTSFSDSDIKLYVSYGDKVRPTYQNNEFQSISDSKSQILSINNNDILPRLSMAGNWIIGIYSDSFVSFSLTITYEESKIIKLDSCIPIEIELEKDHRIYFEYFHISNQSFEFRLTREYGHAWMYANVYNSNSSPFDNSSLPTPTNYTWKGKAYGINHDIMRIENNDTNFCTMCYYIIGVDAKTSIKFNIYTGNENDFMNLIAGKSISGYVLNNKYDRYAFKQLNNRMIDINIISYSGLPEVYIHHNPVVNITHYLWKGTVDQDLGYINLRIEDYNKKLGIDYEPKYWDGKEYKQSNINMIYIGVYGSEGSNSNYSIILTVRNSSTYLIGGHLLYGFLFPGETNSYKYTINELYNFGAISNNQKKYIKVTINTYHDKFLQYEGDDSEISKFEITAKYKAINGRVDGPIQEIQYDYKDKLMKCNSNNNSHLKSCTHYRYPYNQGKYIFSIHNPNHILTLNYSIVINQNDIYQLPLNVYHISRIFVEDQDIYQINIEQKGILAIEIYECFGEVKLKATDSYEKMMAGTFDIELNRNPKAIFGKLGVEAGIIYLSVKGIDGVIDHDSNSIKEALYKINTKFFKMNDIIPYDAVIPGDEGRVLWNLNKSTNEVTLQWNSAEIIKDDIPNSQNFNDANLKFSYRLVITEDPIVSESLSRCEYIPSNFSTAFADRSQYHKTLSFVEQTGDYDINRGEDDFLGATSSQSHIKNISLIDMANQTGTYFASVVGMVNYHEGPKIKWEFPLIYETIQFEIPDMNKIMMLDNATGGNNNNLALIMMIVFFTIAILGLLSYYYYKRYKRIKARLTYEMTDVRNVAANLSFNPE